MANTTIAEVQLRFYEQPIVLHGGSIANVEMEFKGSLEDLVALIIAGMKCDEEFRNAIHLAANYENQNP